MQALAPSISLKTRRTNDTGPIAGTHFGPRPRYRLRRCSCCTIAEYSTATGRNALLAKDEIQLTSVSATNVLYEYNHFTEFDGGKDFIIIYGPNGIGKTQFLEMIDAVAKLQMSRLLRAPFENLVLDYSDGSKLVAQRKLGDREKKSNAGRFSYSNFIAAEYAPGSVDGKYGRVQ